MIEGGLRMPLTPPLGFSNSRAPYDFGKLKIRGTSLRQVQSDIVRYRNVGFTRVDTMSNEQICELITTGSIEQKRALSKWFYEKSGVYSRAVRYISDVFKFDYMLYPNLNLEDELEEKKQKAICKKFNSVLEHFDNSAIQLICRRWAQKVCSEGSYYGYICDDIDDKLVIQDLPIEYCRSRFNYRGLPLVEFNVEYFDKITWDAESRKRVLELFPKEIQAGYRKYKANKLQPEDFTDKAGWILLDIDRAFKFNFLDNDVPPFLSAIPSLVELEEIQDLQKEKLLQEIQKILIQKFNLDKNGQIPFTMTELQQLNQNALDMVGDAVGVSVLSTVADVHLENVTTTNSNEASNSVEAAQKDAYNNFGISTNLFNTDGNLALDKSIIIDEAFAKPLLLQFEQFFNRYLEWKFNKKDYKFRMKMLTTSIFNYRELSKEYKDLTKLGFSRFLPMVALGHTQKEVTSLAKLEQQILQLDAYMLPPFSSNTMSSDTWQDIKILQDQILKGRKGQSQNSEALGQQESNNGNKNTSLDLGEEGSVGRPELPDSEKSDKTLANLASR